MLEQSAWLKKVVKTPEFKNAKFRIVLSHAAPTLQVGTPNYMKNNVRTIIDDLFSGKNPENRIQLWISGHVHTSRRSYPNSDKTLVLQQVKNLITDSKQYPFTTVVYDARGGKMIISGIMVNVTENALEVKNIKFDGTLIDHFSVDSDGKVTDIFTLLEEYKVN